MATWDEEDFEPNPAVANHWEGEDEDDDDIKDNWDDDDEEEKKEVVSVPKPEPKKKKTIAEKIREKEEKQKQEKLARLEEIKKMEEENRELTPEEQMEEKLRRQRLQEEADLEIAKDAFGITDAPVVPGQKTIDNFAPINKEEFLELSNMIVQKFNKLEVNTDYLFFLETLVRDCCAGLDADDIKKITSTLNSLVNEKQKLAKVGKGKKKTAGASKKTLATGKGVKDDMDFDDGYYNEFDDFM